MDRPDRTDIVARAKADLVASGVDLSGPCGAFRIVNLAANMLRALGDPAGVLYKPTGNNCQERAVDIIAYPDGAIFDVLINAETENTPSWQPREPVDIARYRDPFPESVPVPVPTPDPNPIPPDVGPILTRLNEIERRLDAIDIAITRHDAFLDADEERFVILEGRLRGEIPVRVGRTWGHSHQAVVAIP